MAPSVLILFNTKEYNDANAAKRIKDELEEKYQDKGFSIKRYDSPFDYKRTTGMQQEQLIGLDQATHVIMLFSPSFIREYSNHSHWSAVVQRDPTGERGIIIPIRIEPCDFSQIIASTSCLDLYNLPENGRMSEEMCRKLHGFFEDALETWQRYHNPPVPPAQEVAKPQADDPLKSLPDYPEPRQRFFNAKDRNFFFTGQEHLLTRIEQAYRGWPASTVHKIALSGLRGSGKTQIAVEYAHRFYSNGLYQYVLWIDGGIGSTSSLEQLDTKIKPLLQELRQKGVLTDPETRRDAETLKKWLENHQKWLLIFDEIDEVANIFQYLPPVGYGRVLVTTCARSVSNAEKILVDKMSQDDAILFLLKRAGRKEVSPNDLQQAQKIVQAMEYLPLAIDHVGEYLERSQRDLRSYADSFLKMEDIALIKILQARYGVDRYYPMTLVQSWRKHFELLQNAHPIAADLLSFCAFFRPEGTYEKIILDGHSMLSPNLAQMSNDMFADTSFDTLLMQLGKYSFIEQNKQMLSVHPFLHLILLDQMSREQQQEWAKQAIEAAYEACFLLPDDLNDEEEKQRWLPQLEACDQLKNRWHLKDLDALMHKVQKLMERKAKWSVLPPPGKSP